MLMEEDASQKIFFILLLMDRLRSELFKDLDLDANLMEAHIDYS